MEKIIFKDLTIRAVNIPLKKPIVSHLGTFEKWPYICLDIHTNTDIIGKSYIGPYLVEQLPSISSCIKALSNKFINKEILPSNFFDEGMRSISLLGYKGTGLYALASLDIAFWDAHAKAANAPLAKVLGGSLEAIKAYNSRGLWLIDIKQIAHEAEALMKEGNFNAIKLRIGRETLEEDILAFQEVRRGTQKNMKIFSDFNQKYTLSEAMIRLSKLDDLGFEWFEEPIKFDDLEGYSKLCYLLKTPIMIGENFHGPKDVKLALEKNASDMIMPDLMRIGGVTGWLRAAAIAESYDINFSTHLFPEVSSHLMSATPTSDWLEWTDWANPILKEPYKIKDGYIIIPDKPGTGIDWNEDSLEKYAVDI